ncbi:hypothetical protein PR202_gb11720 [Eleusine coracana subsp. coracana]|uniref:Uncharacterized protein n=1 Tax=Eleusine coracana subsp. coracana TaxID=191504 RepID=A0AAV5EPK0_ELECO|nr:hypothetical protein PR202_gb11720 [Eleusine coracana subsp. coracana]
MSIQGIGHMVTLDGEIIVKDPMIVEVMQALKRPITTQMDAGLFTPEYHKDDLAKAIGTKEHGGHVRGVSSSATWKEESHKRKGIMECKDEEERRDQKGYSLVLDSLDYDKKLYSDVVQLIDR